MGEEESSEVGKGVVTVSWIAEKNFVLYVKAEKTLLDETGMKIGEGRRVYQGT